LAGLSRRSTFLVAAIVLAGQILLTAGPAPGPAPQRPPRPALPPITERKIQLADHAKAIYLSSPAQARRTDVIVLYASGDGGWFGRAIDMFRDIADAGYPVVGIGSHDYPPNAQQLDAATLRRRIATDYQAILAEGRTALGLPAGTKAILTGWSLGGSYAVLAATDGQLAPDLAGIVAWGLPDGEETAIRASADDPRARWDPYASLSGLGPLRRGVIQATGDRFTTAAEARRLSGADSPVFMLYTIRARNHRFDEGLTAFRQSLRAALDWIADAGAASTRPPASAPPR
jgi:dienelactone hydrolase